MQHNRAVDAATEQSGMRLCSTCDAEAACSGCGLTECANANRACASAACNAGPCDMHCAFAAWHYQTNIVPMRICKRDTQCCGLRYAA